MGTLEKIKTLGMGAKFDNCGCSVSPKKIDRVPDAISNAIFETSTEAGKTTKLFKTLMSNACSFDCGYCLNSTSCKNKAKKTAFEPFELAKTFNFILRKGYVSGLFLSSAVTGEADVMAEKMVEAVSLIRYRYNFRGYIHMKVLPGTSYHLVKEASKLASRLSINIEAPNKSRINEISSTKEFKNDILKRQSWIKDFKPPAGQTTQFVVGAAGESDLEIMKMVDWEYKNMDLTRMYYSAFSPLNGTPFENKEKAEKLRSVRLYNIDFMLRKYGIKMDELKGVLGDNDMLPREDPKMVLARNNFDGSVDVNEARYDELVRVPGIGPKSAQKVISFRRSNIIKKYEDLHKLGVVVKRAKPFIDVDGKRQMRLMF